MTGLNPTPDRLAILRAVSAGKVTRRPGGTWIDETSTTPCQVTGIVVAMQRAGWVNDTGQGALGLTNAGRNILAGGGR